MPHSRPDRPTLTVEGGQVSLSVTLSPGETILVGSDRSAGLRIVDPGVAPIHSRVGWDALGVSIADAGSGRGTWLNGERVEASPLGHGDVVTFGAPRPGGAAPALRVSLPASLAEPEPLERVAPVPPRPRTAPPGRIPGLAARIAAAAAEARAGRRRTRLRRATAAVAAAVVLGVGTFLVSAWMASGPAVVVVTPSAAEPGQPVSISGRRFADVAASNVVWFGGIAEAAESSTGDTLHLRVPAAAPPGDVALVVQTPRGRSRRVVFRVLPLLRAESLEPEGGLPGEEVVLRGQGFGPGAVVSVGRAAAEIVSVEPHAIRFRVPAVSAPEGARVPLVATVAGRSAPPVPIVLGRLPRVESVEPPQAAAGEIVRLRGVAFAADPDANAVTFDGVGAVVVAASPAELAVVVPVVTRPQAEVPASLVVQARGRSSEARPYPILRLVDGAFVPRCILHVAVDGAGGGPLLVGSQLGPLMLLASRDEAESVPRRALGTCARLTAALDRARSGEAVSFEARAHPTGGVGVGLVGRPEMIERVTAEDAAAYQRPPGLPPRREAPEPEAVARLWAALLDDLVALTVTGEAPTRSAAVSPAAGRAYAELRRALPWRAGEGVSSATAVALPPQTRRQFRAAALSLP